MNSKRPTRRLMIIKTAKVKENLDGSERKLVTHKGIPIRLSANFSTEALQARRDLHAIFKMNVE